MDSDRCVGPSKPCPSNDHVCSSSYSVTSLGGMEVLKHVVRECSIKPVCDKSGSISVPNGMVRTSHVCCATNNCLPGPPRYPLEQTLRNGLSCESCVDVNSDTCVAHQDIECTGNETRCITIVTYLEGATSSSMAIRGCANQDICEAGEKEVKDGNFKVKTKFSCTGGSNSLQHNLILLAFSSISLLKWLL
ncbi:hypothetical protein GDO86_012170 [Hymenochirus boettgeri]|uniref:UPAR/Ly6 domain-containing protein n=1 Tax=Hymenochirus boettgeri TaxID=247094 RepID=A0A8T2ITF9_9PIPI|nr:hypothetical protein GDO86_012170 [Hymenochirus boettgeri]